MITFYLLLKIEEERIFEEGWGDERASLKTLFGSITRIHSSINYFRSSRWWTRSWFRENLACTADRLFLLFPLSPLLPIFFLFFFFFFFLSSSSWCRSFYLANCIRSLKPSLRTDAQSLGLKEAGEAKIGKKREAQVEWRIEVWGDVG